MDINLEFIEDDYFKISLKNYIRKLFNIKDKILGIILFGSLARNSAEYTEKKISYIDIIVIFKNGYLSKDPIQRIQNEIELIGNASLGIDSFWLEKRQFEKLVKNKADLILSALSDGKILYDPQEFIFKMKTELFKELKEKGVRKKDNYWIWPLNKLGEEIEW